MKRNKKMKYIQKFSKVFSLHLKLLSDFWVTKSTKGY